MYVKLTLINARAISLRTGELLEICFWIPLQKEQINNMNALKVNDLPMKRLDYKNDRARYHDSIIGHEKAI